MTPFERIRQTVGLIDHDPNKREVCKFLSKHLDPLGRTTAVSWMKLNSEGLFDYQVTTGLSTKMDAKVKVSLSDDNVIAESLRLGQMQMWNMKTMYENYADATHFTTLSSFPTGLAMPLTQREILGFAFHSEISELRQYMDYFECIRLILVLWQSKLDSKQSEIPQQVKLPRGELTDRQQRVLLLMREGKTNATIAVSLGFSESLIRQETIAIYRKLGVKGRKEIMLV